MRITANQPLENQQVLGDYYAGYEWSDGPILDQECDLCGEDCTDEHIWRGWKYLCDDCHAMLCPECEDMVLPQGRNKCKFCEDEQ